jgi:hypothetical protein
MSRMRWKDSLYQPDPEWSALTDAVRHLTGALDSAGGIREDHLAVAGWIIRRERIAAEAEHGHCDRVEDFGEGLTDDELIWLAISRCDTAGYDVRSSLAYWLRHAEATLRTLWKRQQEPEPEPEVPEWRKRVDAAHADLRTDWDDEQWWRWCVRACGGRVSERLADLAAVGEKVSGRRVAEDDLASGPVTERTLLRCLSAGYWGDLSIAAATWLKREIEAGK